MILLVDDDVFGMKPYVMTLEDAGFRVKSADGPDSALEALERFGPAIQLVVLDVMMPSGETFWDAEVADGLRTGRLLLARIRADFPSLPVVVLSITDFEEMVIIGNGQVDYLSKADTLPNDLLERVQALLGGAAG